MYEHILVNDITKIDIEESGSGVSIKVLSSDDNIYYVKLSHINKNINLHEYLAHIVANQIDAPIPKGNFIILQREHYQQVIDKILQKIKITEETKGFRITTLDKYLKYLNDTLKNTVSQTFLLFGILFIEDAIDNLTKEIFEEIFNKIKHIDVFYSLFAFDHYLDNSDRHIRNILLLNDFSIAYLIDHDLIFGGKSLNSLGINKIDKTLFRCPKNTHNNYLYQRVTSDREYLQVLKYANKISSMNSHILTKEINKNYYKLSDSSLALITDYLFYRQKKIVVNCEKMKERCYDKIS